MSILVINPGSTSTKIAIYSSELEQEFLTNIYHTLDQLQEFKSLWDQYEFRLKTIEEFIHNCGVDYQQIDAVVGRGGLLHPISGGVYEINDLMLNDLQSCRYGEHASNLGAPLAYHLAQKIGESVPSFILDPVIVDELDEIARLSGHPLLPRKSIFHALGQKAAARRYAQSIGSTYEKLNVIVAHMGGGITIGAHKNGRVVDVNNGLDGEGPFTPERSGTLPAGELLKMAYSGKYTLEQMKKMLKGEGGLVSYLHTSDCREIERVVKSGDEHVTLIYSAMAYDVSKYIGAMATVLEGRVDAIILSGGLAYSELFCNMICDRVEFIAPVSINRQECEMSALAQGALDALAKRVRILTYSSNSKRA